MGKMIVGNNLGKNRDVGGTILKIVIRFFYIFLLFLFFNITFAYVSGEFGKIFTLQNVSLGSVIMVIFWGSMVSLVLAIAFVLSTWKWYVGGIFATIIAFFVNTGLDGGGYNFGTLMFTIFEIPIFLGIAAVIYLINKGYEKIPKRWLQLTIAGLPFIILFLLLIGASLTCSFGNNSVCVAKGTSSSDVTACEKSSISLAQDCYREFAKRLNDPNVCNDIERLQHYEICLRAFILEKEGDLTTNVCDSAPDNKINTCYRFLGKAKKDPTICEKISENDKYNLHNCYSEIAGMTGDVSLCEKIFNRAGKGNCYIRIAEFTKDASYCEKATAGNKEYCYNQVERLSS